MIARSHNFVSMPRLKAALVLVCLLTFTIVSLAHTAHDALQVWTPVQTVMVDAEGDSSSDPAQASVGDICLACAIAVIPVDLFQLYPPAPVAAVLAQRPHAFLTGTHRAENPPPIV